MNFLIKKRKEKFHLNAAERLQKDITMLVDLFKHVPCEVFLTGGMGMAVRYGKFYRSHKDIDLAIFKDDLPVFKNHLENCNYSLVVNFFMTHISPWHDLYGLAPATNKSVENYSTGRVKLRGLSSGSTFRYIKQNANIFDLFLWQRSDKGVIPVGYNTVIPWKDFYPADRVSENSGLLLPNIKHKIHLAPRVPKQYVDMDVNKLKDVTKEVENRNH